MNDANGKPKLSSLEQSIQETLSKRKTQGSFRQLTVNPPNSIDFSSNDFLSLSTSSEVRSQYIDELREYHQSIAASSFMLGSGGSRLLDGNSKYAEALETQLCDFHNSQAGLLCNSGFDANVAIFSTLPQPGDIILYDEYIHASVHDGMRLSRASQCIPFAHNSVPSIASHLRRLAPALQQSPSSSHRKSIFIAVEAIYSMDGDTAPLSEIVSLVSTHLPRGNTHLIIDEAHSTGVLGPKGRGLVSSLSLEHHFTIRLHTFGKSLAANGAVILCSSPLIRTYLLNYARPLIYTTFLSFPALAAIKTAYAMLASGYLESRQAHLIDLISSLHSRLQTLEARYSSSSSSQSTRKQYPRHLLQIPVDEPKTPIFSLLSSKPKELAAYCQRNGLVVRGIVSPTVPVGKERVRVCLHAGNTIEDLDRLVQVIGNWLTEEMERQEEPQGRTREDLQEEEKWQVSQRPVAPLARL